MKKVLVNFNLFYIKLTNSLIPDEEKHILTLKKQKTFQCK